MKTFNLTFIVILFFFQLSAFSQWILQSPTPTENRIYSVYFVNTEIGYMVGNHGTILKSTDGGINWQSQSSGTTNNLNSVFFTDENNGCAVGSEGTIVITYDGGNTWTSQQLEEYSRTLRSVHFPEPNIGYAVGGTFYYPPIKHIFKTMDGGMTWTAQNGGGASHLYSVYFSNAYNGLIVGASGTILKTDNGGEEWSYTAVTDNSLHSIRHTENNTYFVAGSSGILLKTENGGNNWIEQTINDNINFISMCFTDANTGFILGYYDDVIGEKVLLKTMDAGESWNSKIISIPNYPWYSMNEIHFFDEEHGFITGMKLFKSDDGGDSWSQFTEEKVSHANSVFFMDSLNGVIVGHGIYKTVNGGIDWTKVSYPNIILNSVYFVNADVGYAAGGGIYKTNDGGDTWIFQSAGITQELNSIYFIDELNGFAVGTSGDILKTSDGGNTWSIISIYNSTILNSIYFYDKYLGFAAGGSSLTGKSLILRTGDGGENWNPVYSVSSYGMTLNSISFLNENRGFAVGDVNLYNTSGSRLMTTDGGASWTSQDPLGGGYLKSVCFVNDSTGYAVGNWGTILKTSDGGLNWNYNKDFSDAALKSVFFIDENIGVAVGGSTILQTINGGSANTSILNMSELDISIYPNPTNKDIIIKVEDLLDKAKLELLNVYGQLIYSTEFILKTKLDLSFYKPGIYLVRVSSNNISSTEKIIKY